MGTALRLQFGGAPGTPETRSMQPFPSGWVCGTLVAAGGRWVTIPAPPWVAVPTPPGSLHVSLEDAAQGPASAGGFPRAPHPPGTCPHLCVPSPPSGAFLRPLFPSSASSLLPSELRFSIFPCALRWPSSSSPSAASSLVLGAAADAEHPPGTELSAGLLSPWWPSRPQSSASVWVPGGGGWGALPGGVRELEKQAEACGAGHGRAEPACSCSPGASGFLPPSLPLSPEVPGNDGGPWGERLSGGGGGGAATRELAVPLGVRARSAPPCLLPLPGEVSAPG